MKSYWLELIIVLAQFLMSLVCICILRAEEVMAAANTKVPDRMFKRHGHWKSENAKDGYVKDDVKSRLEVSKSLGLYLDIPYSLLS